MKKLFLLLLIFMSTTTVFAQTIRIGTVAPAGSIWERALKEVAAEWTRISNGRINVIIHAGGTMGDEENILRQMRLGRLHAAAFTPYGMKNISDDLFVLSIPMLIKDDEEFDFVFERIRPSFERELRRNGFVALGWTNTGWVRWFSRTKVLYPDDLRRIRLAVDRVDQSAIQVMQRSGFRVIPLNFIDIGLGLQNNMVDATFLTPYAVSAMGITRHIPFMLDMPISPVYCLLVMDERAWRRIDERYRPMILQRTAEIFREFYPRMIEAENAGIEVMRRQGFTVVPVTQSALAEWEQVIGESVGPYKQQTFSPQIQAEVRRYIDEFRRSR
ncbi:MAG: TRAP transporter substrate-binding protein DctP [Spirochaetes bacterium]|nr:TRAP transporter substrate-binding protein DctP [Spirochaetota bacterium]